MNELDRLRQEAEALKHHIREARKNVRDCNIESRTDSLDTISKINMRARRLVLVLVGRWRNAVLHYTINTTINNNCSFSVYYMLSCHQQVFYPQNVTGTFS